MICVRLNYNDCYVNKTYRSFLTLTSLDALRKLFYTYNDIKK